jgi:hypothetical protein
MKGKGISKIILFIILIFNNTFLFSQVANENNTLNLGDILDFSAYNEGLNGYEFPKVVISYMDMASFTFRPISIKSLREQSFSVKVILQEIDFLLKAHPFIQKIKEKKLIFFNSEEFYENVRCVVDFYIDDKIWFSYAIFSHGTSLIINNVHLQMDQDFFDFVFVNLPRYCYEDYKKSGFCFYKVNELE